MSSEPEQWVWVEDRAWVALSPAVQLLEAWRCCRGAKSCPGRVVARLERSGHKRRAWWFYCADHLYGRRIEDGRVWLKVHPASAAARRGFAVGGQGVSQ